MEKEYIPSHHIDDEQLNDEFYLLNMKGRIDRHTVRAIRLVKEQLPYKEGDFKLVEVQPFKDEFIDYSEVIFDLTALLEPEELYNDDETTVFMTKQHARVLAQVGALFDIVFDQSTRLEILATPEANFEDDSRVLWSPTSHSPDLPTGLPDRKIDLTQLELPNFNGQTKEKPIFQRKRLDPKISQEII